MPRYKNWSWSGGTQQKMMGTLALNDQRGRYLTPEVENSAWEAPRVCLSSLFLDQAPLEGYLKMNSTHWRWLWLPLQVIARAGRLPRVVECTVWGSCSCLYAVLEKWRLVMVFLPWPLGSRCFLALAFSVLICKMKVLNEMIAMLLSHANSLWATSLIYVSKAQWWSPAFDSV